MLKNLLSKTLINILKIYRFFSPFFYRGACRFTPTCSQYAIQAILKYGPIVGVYKSIIRLLKCNPFGKWGYDPVDGKK